MRTTLRDGVYTYYFTVEELEYFASGVLDSYCDEVKKRENACGYSLFMQLKNGRKCLTRKQLFVIERVFIRCGIDFMALIDDINLDNSAYIPVETTLNSNVC